MKSLLQHMKEMLDVWDCHVHMFGRKGIGKYPKPIGEHSKFISMVDNPLKYKDEKLEPYFEEYFKEHGKHVLPGYVLCVGRDVDETKKIFKRWESNFVGFGEIMAHKHYKDSDDKEHLMTDVSILGYAAQVGLPVFVHWDLDGKEDDVFVKVLESNPKTKFVLCHCGINELDDPHKAFDTAVKLQVKHPNLWLDLSWKGLEFVCADMKRLSIIENLDHTLVGTDFNASMELFDVDFDKVYGNFRKVIDKVNLKTTINNLLAN